MHHVLAISPIKLLDLWDQLHSAMNGTNTFGGDVLEFYFYRLMGSSPLAVADPNSPFLDVEFRDASNSLFDLCKLFEDRHDVRITLEDGSSLDTLRDGPDINRHRVHLRVSKKPE